jgi:hypothetical protein
MKNDDKWQFYISYLDMKLMEGKITKGSYSLLKMSKQSFDDFKDRFEEDELFQKKVIKLRSQEIRDRRIGDILDETD